MCEHIFVDYSFIALFFLVVNTVYIIYLLAGEKETPIQKYQRLQCEMKELLEDVNNLNKDNDDKKLDCLVPTEQVEQSLKLLADLKLEETLGEELIAKISDPEGAQIK